MARAALAVLEHGRLEAAAGLVVAPNPGAVDGLDLLVGDHPLPGPASARAAAAIETFCRETPPATPVWLFLSGGATSLMAGPEPGLSVADLTATFDQLLRSGLDIAAMNAVRKRLSRLAGGKLAVALQHTSILQLVVSDVIGDDLAAIGSGPAVPDPARAAEILGLIDRSELRGRIPGPAVRLLEETADGRRAETPKPSHPAFGMVTTRIVASNRIALEGAAAAAHQFGWMVEIKPEPVRGEARIAGTAIAEMLTALPPSGTPTMIGFGGETTVHVGAATGRGGRCQELALGAAAALACHPSRSAMLLAAGTDGRDGPTDAAGAVVDGATWAEIEKTGANPAAALERHDCYPALDAAGALFRTGPTGTNVMDVVLGLVTPDR
jgi:hydroxypyruvate reductase